MRTVIADLEAMGEKQLETFVSDRLVVSKVPISQKITLNKIEIWNHTDTGQLKCKVEFSPSKSALKKMNSACEHRKTMAEELFEHEINNIPQSLWKDDKKGSKAEITKRFNSPCTLSTSVMLPQDQEGKSAIVVEMSPLIRAKAFATHTGSLTNFGEFAVLVYYEVMKHACNYDRIDLVFDRYFEKSLKEGTRSGRGEGSQYLFEGDSTEIPYKMADSFFKNNQNKNELKEYLSLKLLELHQGDQIMIAT